MPADYNSIRAENLRKYGEEIDRIGRMLLAERYDDRTHFIFEILQNAEDALSKRTEWAGARTVDFSLSFDNLTISHFGKLFDEADVRGVCGIGESTKALTDIGRFGIGFKSVYAFTENPEIHSGQEHFAIDSYVWPKAAKEVRLQAEETQILIPFPDGQPDAREEILKGLRRLGPRTLLFLREIEEISWSVADGPSGLYLRSKPEILGNDSKSARKVVVIGQDDARGDVDEEWMVFSREVFNEEISAGHVEVAFALDHGGADSQSSSVRRVMDSPLVVFFPTVLSTNLGFLVQGPYRTTPSRDNVPQGDPWNLHLVQETAVLLVDALKELRNHGLLDLSAIQCLPLDASRFPEDSRFAPLFQAVREAFRAEPLLPDHSGGHIAAQNAKLARTQDLRALISSDQLTDLFSPGDGLVWLSGEITLDRTPELRDYLIEELEVGEVTPESLVPRLTKEFLEAQSDEWLERLYAFLNGQRALLPRLQSTPLIRLENGMHTVAVTDSGPQAYLPGDSPTGFPTVKRSVCQSADAREFLESLQLRVPDPVDDVIVNILPKYHRDQVDVPVDEYESDIKRVLAAFATDSASQRNNLLNALRRVKFVLAVDTSSEVSRFVRPGDAYLATERLKGLFAGVPGVLLVDDSRDYLRGERIRDLLQAAGTQEYLVPVQVDSSLTAEEKHDLRFRFGDARKTEDYPVEDYTLRGLDPLLVVLDDLPTDEAGRRAELLWQALRDVQNRRGNAAFNGVYRWFYFTRKSMVFTARFVQKLNEVAWVPDRNGVLHSPRSVVFKETGWEEEPSLAARILFRPDALNELAMEAGIDPDALADALIFLKKHGEAELRKRLIVEDDPAVRDDQPADETERPPKDDPGPIVPAPDKNDGAEPRPSGPRKFISYVAVGPDDHVEDPDGLSHQARMDLESQAIDLILSEEQTLQRTPANNPGFDLKELGPTGDTIRWVEVKSMKGTLNDRPVGLSSTQFEFAQKHRDAYWLYVVERAGDPTRSHIVRIKDPAGKAQTFTFDHGWVGVSENLNETPG